MQCSPVLYLVHLINEQNEIKYEDYSNKMGSVTVGTLVVQYGRHEVAVLNCCNRLACFTTNMRTYSVRYYCTVHQYIMRTCVRMYSIIIQNSTTLCRVPCATQLLLHAEAHMYAPISYRDPCPLPRIASPYSTLFGREMALIMHHKFPFIFSSAGTGNTEGIPKPQQRRYRHNSGTVLTSACCRSSASFFWL